MTSRRTLKAGPTGLVVVGLALALAACGSTPPRGVASLPSAPTTAPHASAPAATSGGGASGGGASGGGASGGGASGGAAPAGGSSHMVMAAGNYTEALKFARCMRSNGVADFPDPSGNGTISVDGLNPRSPQFQMAARVCRKLLPNGGQPTPAQQSQDLAQALKLSQCMRAHGITDFPDPQTAPGGGISMSLRFTPGSDLNPGSPLFDAAQKACHSNLPAPVASPAG